MKNKSKGLFRPVQTGHKIYSFHNEEGLMGVVIRTPDRWKETKKDAKLLGATYIKVGTKIINLYPRKRLVR